MDDEDGEIDEAPLPRRKKAGERMLSTFEKLVYVETDA